MRYAPVLASLVAAMCLVFAAARAWDDNSHPAGVRVAVAATPTPTVEPAPARATPVAEPVTAHTYTVQAGDVMWRIAEHLCGDSARSREFTRRDGSKPGADIYPGEVLIVPEGCSAGDSAEAGQQAVGASEAPVRRDGSSVTAPVRDAVEVGDAPPPPEATGAVGSDDGTQQLWDAMDWLARTIVAAVPVVFAHPWEATGVLLTLLVLSYAPPHIWRLYDEIQWRRRRPAPSAIAPVETESAAEDSTPTMSREPDDSTAPPVAPPLAPSSGGPRDAGSPPAGNDRQGGSASGASALVDLPTPEDGEQAGPDAADGVRGGGVDTFDGGGAASAAIYEDEVVPERIRGDTSDAATGAGGDAVPPPVNKASEEAADDSRVGRSSGDSDYQRDPFLGDAIFGAPDPGVSDRRGG